MSAAESVVSLIQHYQKSIQKNLGNPGKIVHCINKLYKLPVTVQHLQDTGVGKTINSLRKSDGEVGEAARSLVYKWKQMVEEESENEQEIHSEEQESSNRFGNSKEEGNGHKFAKRNKEIPERLLKDSESPRNGSHEHQKNSKRRAGVEVVFKEKRYKPERESASGSHASLSNSNLEDENFDSYKDWNDGKLANGMNTRAKNDGGSKDFKAEWVDAQDCDKKQSGVIENVENFVSHSHNKQPRQDRKEDKVNKCKSSKSVENSHQQMRKNASHSSEKTRNLSNRNELEDAKTYGSCFGEEKSCVSDSSISSLKESVGKSDKSKSSKVEEKHKKSKHKDKHRSKDEKRPKEKKKQDLAEEDGVDSFSGKSFGEALGMIFPSEKSKTKRSSVPSSSESPHKKKRKSSPTASERKFLSDDSACSSSKLPLDFLSIPAESSSPTNEDFGLPALNPYYKPLPQPNLFNSPTKKPQNEDDDLSNLLYSKVQRTKVYSGNKTGYTYVPSLFDLCIRVLQENIDALEYTGGVPFDLLKPVLERATPDQLFTLEDYNPYLIEDTDMFWEYHCKKDFRTKKREEMETWREMYMRCREERELKLKSITANIAASSKAKALPVRKTQLAYIESAVKPPRNIARKQAKFGTANPSASSGAQKQTSVLSSSFAGRSSFVAATGPAVPVPTPRGAGGSSQSNSCKPKPKAPLMQKALQLVKYNRFKR